MAKCNRDRFFQRRRRIPGPALLLEAMPPLQGITIPAGGSAIGFRRLRAAHTGDIATVGDGVQAAEGIGVDANGELSEAEIDAYNNSGDNIFIQNMKDQSGNATADWATNAVNAEKPLVREGSVYQEITTGRKACDYLPQTAFATRGRFVRTPSYITTDGDFLFVILTRKAADPTQQFVLLNAHNTPGNFGLTADEGSASTVIWNNVTAPGSVLINGVAFTGTTRGNLYDALPDGVAVIAMRGFHGTSFGSSIRVAQYGDSAGDFKSSCMLREAYWFPTKLSDADFTTLHNRLLGTYT